MAASGLVTPVGARTHWQVGGMPSGGGEEVRAPAGIGTYDPADLTVRVGAGTSVRELNEVLAGAAQECVLDPRSADATVGGVLACGLSGLRRLRWGPVRDRVLEVHVQLADGRVVKGGGPTVKNVTGYDVPRLIVGSLGTIGVITEAVLRCQPLPAHRVWVSGSADPFAVRARATRPSTIVWDGETTWAQFEGHRRDIDDEIASSGLRAGGADDVTLPDGPYRGRISVRPSALRTVGPALAALGGVRWLAEVGVGTVHVAADDAASLIAARHVAHDAGGWMLREAGVDVEPFGCELPNLPLLRRLQRAFDPDGRMNRGRVPC